MSPFLRFAPPVAPKMPHRIEPLFLPFAGCEYRCIFCSQSLQSGTAAKATLALLADLETRLDAALSSDKQPRELAFYGGTFTALPESVQEACLACAAKYRKLGLITRVRASTRPDKISPRTLDFLRANGLDLLELGIQSFDDAVLAASRPGYSGEEALAACAQVHQSGLALGVQLMPGLPGMDAASFRRDMQFTLQASPEVLRLYPCLVIEGTELARLWRNGAYHPWELEPTIALLGKALLAAEQQAITVIRMGLAPEPGLAPNLLAGPMHPSLGSRVRGRALYELVRERASLLGNRVSRLLLPRRLRGEFSGHKGELLPWYAALGLHKKAVHWHDHEYCEVSS